MPRQPKPNTVTRIEPANDQGHTPQPAPPAHHRASAPPGYYYHPHTGDLVPMPNDHGHAGPPSRQHGGFQAAPGQDLEDGASDYVLQGSHRVRINPDGSRTSAFEGQVYIHEGANERKASEDVPYAMSKWRIALGLFLALLAVMTFIDLAGAPHVRVEPGVYASLEGKTTIDNPDAPLIILHRLDGSVFGHAFNGIGWAFSRLGGGD